MAVLCEREDVVSTARDGCENALALADLSALEEIDATEVVERLVHNVLVAQHAGRAVTAGVQTTRGIQSDGDVLRVTLRTLSHCCSMMSQYSLFSCSSACSTSHTLCFPDSG